MVNISTESFDAKRLVCYNVLELESVIFRFVSYATECLNYSVPAVCISVIGTLCGTVCVISLCIIH
jgi:hypothetical protein